MDSYSCSFSKFWNLLLPPALFDLGMDRLSAELTMGVLQSFIGFP